MTRLVGGGDIPVGIKFYLFKFCFILPFLFHSPQLQVLNLRIDYARVVLLFFSLFIGE